jgi:hypothetical protein
VAGDVVVAAADTRFRQSEPKRGVAPLGGATIRYVQRAGWGNAVHHLLRADEFVDHGWAGGGQTRARPVTCGGRRAR